MSYGASCIDANNNGLCGDAGDVPLGQAIDANGLYLDAEHGSHSGLVLQGAVSLPVFLYVQVTRDIHVSGTLEVSTDSLGPNFQTLRGNITVSPRTTIIARTSLTFGTTSSSATIDIGEHTTITASGNNVDVAFGSNGTLHVGTGQSYKTSGGGYANIHLKGANGVQIDPGQSFIGTGRGGYYISSGGDLDLTEVTCKAGYMIISAYGSPAHPGGRSIATIDGS